MCVCEWEEFFSFFFSFLLLWLVGEMVGRGTEEDSSKQSEPTKTMGGVGETQEGRTEEGNEKKEKLRE